MIGNWRMIKQLTALGILGVIVLSSLVLNATLQNPPEAILGIVIGSGLTGIINIALGQKSGELETKNDIKIMSNK